MMENISGSTICPTGRKQSAGNQTAAKPAHRPHRLVPGCEFAGLAAGGKGIRTLGPAPAKASAECCLREVPERPVGSRIKLRSSRETAMAGPRCAEVPFMWDRDFESRLLQRRVSCEPDFLEVRPGRSRSAGDSRPRSVPRSI
jgi:hypothetical protein